MEKFIHEIKLTGSDEFSKRFNRVSDLFAIAQKEDTKEAWSEYFETKLALEQGYPISFPNEDKTT